MELTQLRYFYQVYRAGSIRSASGELNVTQQALSRQIQNLEKELGVALFTRSISGVEATEYGHMLFEKAEKVLPELESFVYSVQKRKHIVSGVVKLGIQCWQMAEGNNLRYECLREFCRAYPQIRLAWENDSPARCIEGVLEQRLDLCVTMMPERLEFLELTPLRDFQWYMLMAKGHELADRDCLSVEDLSGRKVILAGEETGSRNQITRALYGKTPPEFIDVKEYLFDLLGQEILGNQAMMLTLTAQEELFNPQRFVMVPLKGDLWRSRLYLCRLAARPQTPAAELLFDYLREHWTGFGEISPPELY
ncbi:MAG: LysR family transcriptional regulator [Lachnospiraceae bacterium]|nr:LysR family transcriptional regulator [Lachnospiraceae bacterium]